MSCNFPRVFFLSGTDTGLGKTVLSGILAHGLGAHYWKPIQSGIETSSENPGGTDSSWMELCGIEKHRIIPERYVFNQPLSPHLSSKLDGQRIDLAELEIPAPQDYGYEHLIIEGAGGLLVPLNENDKLIDLIKKWNVPVLLAARSALGTINHTLLSLEALSARQIPVLGVVMMGPSNGENRKAIEKFGNVEVLAEIPILQDFKSSTLLNCFTEQFGRGKCRHENERAENLASVYADANCRSTAKG